MIVLFYRFWPSPPRPLQGGVPPYLRRNELHLENIEQKFFCEKLYAQKILLNINYHRLSKEIPNKRQDLFLVFRPSLHPNISVMVIYNTKPVKPRIVTIAKYPRISTMPKTTEQ